MPRPDNRLAAQLRPLSAEPAALERADGSARLAHGGTELLVAVYGPCEAKRSRESIEGAALDVIVKPCAGLPGPAEREVEQLLVQTLTHAILTTHHPRTAICIVVQVLAADGSLLAAVTHGACLALMHAGVPLRGMLGGCAAALAADGATVLLDPCAEEEREATAVVTKIFLTRRALSGKIERQLLLSHMVGAVGAGTQLDVCQSAASEAAACVVEFYRQALQRVVAPLAASEGGES